MTILLFICLMHSTRIVASQDPQGTQVSAYIELLKSSSGATRQDGKAKLLQVGRASIQPLVSLLEDLVRDDFRPWFALGKEEEGKKAWERRERALNSGDPNTERIASEQLAQLEISGRLENDVMEILGRLQAEDAVPLLIRHMAARRIDNLWEKMRSDMYALAAIGTAAVPPLIELINRADEAAKRNPQGVPAYRIQVRAARVLGLIGDSRALPVLKALFKRKKDILVWQAIQQVEEKNRQKKPQMRRSSVT